MRRSLASIVVLLFVLAAALTAIDHPIRGQAPAEPLRVAGDRPIDIQHIRLDLQVDLPKKTVAARATLQVRGLRPLNAFALDAVDFEVTRVLIGTDDKEGNPARFSHDGKKLVIDLEPAWPADHPATLRIEYRIREPKAGLHFFGPTAVEPEVPLTVWSQGEPVTNRYWFPCLDQPNQKQTTELVVTVAEGFEVLSNGKLVERKANPAEKTVTFHWRQDKPHVSYLVTLVVGQFDIVEEEWNKMPVLYYVPKGHKDEVGRTFGRTREMLTFFSKRFGIDYPWEKYAQVVVEQFTAGGMENTSATTLTDWALHNERASLDSSPDGLIAHELAHQWWGDLVTCRDWSHLWLNEGFATYSEALWAEHHEGADEFALNLMHKAHNAMAHGKDRPVVDRRYPAPWNMFDARSYPKGAWVLHMLRRRLGDEAFWKALRRYGTEHRLQSADTDDFRKTFERETGRNLDRFFYDWTERAGHPVLDIKTEYLPETKQARVVIKQTQSSEAFQFPLTIAFRGPTGSVTNLEQDITEKEHTLFVALPARPTLISVDPGQTLLAEIKEDKSHELWLTQLQEAADPIARIRAARHLGQNKSPADREALAKALASEKFWGVQAEIAAALGESGGDASRDALIQGMKHTHPKVRRACADHLGKFPRDQAATTALKDLLQRGDPSYFVEATALASYAKLQQSDTVTVLLPWLAKPSHREVLRTAALEALGNSHDLAALDTLTLWTKRGKPRNCRTAAMEALAKLAKTANPSEEQVKTITTTLAACLTGESPPIRRTAAASLGELGKSAAPALAAVEALARHESDDRVREEARKSMEKIRTAAPVPVELSRLREELDRVRLANDALRERLDKFEKIESKGK